MRKIAILLFLCLSACTQYPHVNDGYSQLFTEAEAATVSYENWPIWVQVHDSRRNISDLHPIPGTAWIWNSSGAYKLIFKGAYREGEPIERATGPAKQISFKFYGTESSTSDPTPPIPYGTWNISVQLTGVEGIHSVCGRFEISRKFEMIRGSDLH